MKPPTGTVTFLFTDIEGSTRLWEAHPDLMPSVLERHDALIRNAIDLQRGYIFKTMGDAFCAAFSTASAALNAAVGAQKAITAERWPQPIEMTVRMAIHTGTCDFKRDDYFGRALNRVSRLLSSAHGGQILASAAARQLAHDLLPEGCTLRSLGEHRFRDLESPEIVFQVSQAGLKTDFPPLKSLHHTNHPNSLPRQLTSFIGREKEIAHVSRLLEKTDLLTLTGSGGCGKSRLSLQIGADALDSFPDGVWFIELAPLIDRGFVVPTVSQVIGIGEQSGQPMTLTLAQELKNRKLLIILDNCEHLLEECARLSSALLRSCPSVKILATSREPLGIGGEQTFRVPSLSLPSPKGTVTASSAANSEAVRLFAERAQLVKSDFAITGENARALVQVCARLDGIPLAIELASARVRSMPIEEIDARLDNRFRLLIGGDRAALPRHQTLRALIDWSYELLAENEKSLLRRLCVFSGGWTLKDGEALAADEWIADWEVLDLLTGLTDKSLAISEEDSGYARYRLLETVRQYGLERLRECGELDKMKAKHAHMFLDLAEKVDRLLRGAEQDKWLDRLEMEHDNFRTALAWSAQPDGDHTVGLRLASALHRFWSVRGYLSEGREQLSQALSCTNPEELSPARGEALLGLGRLEWFQGDLPAARPHFEEALHVQRSVGNHLGVGYALVNLANVACHQGDYEAAKQMNEEALAIFRSAGDRFGIASAVGNLGNVASDQGNHEAAWPLYEECRDIQRSLGNKFGLAVAIHNLGLAAFYRKDFELARPMFEECLALYRELGYKSGTASMLANLGNVALRQNKFESAVSLFRECLVLRRDIGDKRGLVGSLDEIGLAIASQGHHEGAARIWGAAAELRNSIGLAYTSGNRDQLAQPIEDARSALGSEPFEAAWNSGRTLTWEQAIHLALQAGELES